MRMTAPYALRPSLPRLLSAMHHLMRGAERRGTRLTQYQVVKALFLADREHLNQFGRPITFDNYIAMKHGPVPSMAYDLLRQGATWQETTITLPWTRHPDPEGGGAFRFEAAAEAPPDALSDSDREALDDALTFVLKLTFGQLRRLTHEDVAYLRAWGDGEHNAAPMDLSLLFEEPDPEAAEQLAFASHHV